MEALVNIGDVPVVERQHARAGLFRSQSLLHGEEGTPENFYLQLAHTYSDFHSPRHRHNFDQVRVQLRGDADFARNGVMRPGSIAYFPEGVHYGPQSIAGESATLVLQFGGASGSGYISEARFQEAVHELRQYGTFENGVFRRTDRESGRKNQDAYEAVWEHVNGRRIAYTPHQLDAPVFMDPADFPWQDDAALPGVKRRHLGVFSARRTRLDIIGLQPGAQVQLAPHAIVFVLEGEGSAASGVWKPHATLRTGADGETVQTSTYSELLEMHIPPLTAR
ncbi:hypothetical protein ACO2Q9_03470 [Variovorax sp. VNK109]|jgi:hypothetical protein|uniref:hypothetical protein n=1 Tax=Variovorax sp. VNK109 TaxID=3400919 RepID=UPI003C11E0A7